MSTLDEEIVEILLHYKVAKRIDNFTHPSVEEKYLNQIKRTCAKHFLDEVEKLPKLKYSSGLVVYKDDIRTIFNRYIEGEK